jgi:hypothetical protein
MKKIIFLILGLILISGILFSNIIEERTLSSINSEDIVIDKGENICKDYSFSINNIDPTSQFYLQLFIRNYIPISKEVSIKIYLNDVLDSEIENKDIFAKNIIKLNNIQENNTLSICVDNNSIPRIVISKNSIIGNYYIGEIKDEDFYQEVPKKGYPKTLIPITLYVKNSGYADLDVEIFNATELFIANSNLENVSGETTYKGKLEGQETISLKYYVKTDKVTSFATPYAKLTYTDFFGREVVKYLKNTNIEILPAVNFIEAHIDAPKKIIQNKQQTGVLIIKNNSEETLENIYITPNFTGEVILQENKVNQILPKDVVEIPFKINTFKEGIYSLNFNIDYFVNEEYKSTGSNVREIKAIKEDNSENNAISILIIITVIFFIWIVKI